MQEFCYDDIDLYYYHSTDIDFSRISSILKYGILSANQIKNNNVPYYHRNYIKASCMDDFISVSQFSRNLWHYFQLKNELYDSSASRVVFVINGYIESLEKQSCNNRYKFTTELHVRDAIKREDILGIVVRENDLNKKMIDIPFSIDYSNFNDSLKKCFDVIQFYKDTYDIDLGYDKLYNLVGKLMEAKVCNIDSYKDILKDISQYMQVYISHVYKIVLGIDEPTLKDVLLLYKDQIAIYVMTKYDIKGILDSDKLINSAKERYELSYPNRKFKILSSSEREKLIQEEKIIAEITELESGFAGSDELIYFDNYQGPLSEDGNKINEKIMKLRNSL